MTEKIKLYKAYGELIYAVAMADGKVQDEERSALEGILKDHIYAKEILWSFNYEDKMNAELETSYQNAIKIMKDLGPDPDYIFLAYVLSEVALASNYIDKAEKNLIDRFKSDLDLN